MRVDNTIKIAKSSMISQIVITIIGFVNRIVLVYYLGKEYLGFSGLFSNILSMLALAELGLGGAIAYNLYEPLHNENKTKIAELINFYKKVYRILALLVFSLGIIVMIFIKYLIKDVNDLSFGISYIRLIFFLSLIETVSSYLMVYKTTLLNVGQKKYIITNINTISNIALSVARICILLVFHNYVLYIIVGVLFTITSNFIATKYAVRYYPFIDNSYYKSLKISSKLRKDVINNAANLSVHTLSGYVVNCTDNLIISSFVGVISLGIYSNYNLIFTAVKNMINGAITSIQAPLGDLVVTGNKKRVQEIVSISTMAAYLISSFCAISLLVLSSDFIEIIFGQEYIMDFSVVLISSINIFVWTITRPIWTLSSVTGLFKEDRINALVEAISNAVISIIAVQFWGITGTFVGTLCSYIIAFILKCKLQYRKYFNQMIKPYFITTINYLLLFLIELFIVYYLSIGLKELINNQYLGFIGKVMICLIVPNIFNYTIFKNSNELIFIKNIVLDRLVKNNK